jgi:predicted nucleotidyltransferase
MTIRELRMNKGITQQQAADFVGIPLRTYSNYENDPRKQTSVKYKYIIDTLYTYGCIDEEHGVLTLEKIKEICASVFSEYDVEYCYLFGSYAKGKATPTSDVDLFVNTSVMGLQFFELIEELRERLGKKVDLLDQRQLENNFELTSEILKDGIKIYG